MYGVGYGIGSSGATTVLNSGGSFDADAQSFFSSSGITNLTQKNAVNQLVKDLKSNSLWSKIKAIYPVVGGNATAHSYNLKNTSQYQLSFSSGWTHSSTGMTSNGAAYANTNLNPVSALTNYNTHASIYCRLDGSNAGFDIGITNPSSYNQEYLLAARRGGYMIGAFYDYGGVAGGVTQSTSTSAKGLTLNSSTSSTLQKLYKNNVVKDTNTVLNTSTPSSLPIYIGAVNANSTSVVEYSTNEYSLISIGDGFSDAEVSTFYSIVQTFQTSLSRNV